MEYFSEIRKQFNLFSSLSSNILMNVLDGGKGQLYLRMNNPSGCAWKSIKQSFLKMRG
jgi:hypothetical protein